MEKSYYFGNNSPIFARSSTCARIRDKRRQAAYQLRHDCRIIGVGLVILSRAEISLCVSTLFKMNELKPNLGDNMG